MSWLAAMVGHARARAAVLALQLPKRSGLTVIRPAATHSHLVPGATDPFLSRLATIQIAPCHDPDQWRRPEYIRQGRTGTSRRF